MSELRKHKTYKMLTTTTSMRRTDWATDTTLLSKKGTHYASLFYIISLFGKNTFFLTFHFSH